MRFRHWFRHFPSGYLPQVSTNQGFLNELSPVRCSGFSLSLAHSTEPELPARISGASISLNRHRNAQFRHRFTPFGQTVDSTSHCRTGTCDKCKTGPFVEITPWFTPISDIPTGIFTTTKYTNDTKENSGMRQSFRVFSVFRGSTNDK